MRPGPAEVRPHCVTANPTAPDGRGSDAFKAATMGAEAHDRGYSARSASIGSTRVARRAGSQAAASASVTAATALST